MADVLKIVFLIAGTLTVFISYWLLAEGLFPEMVDRSRQRYHSQPLKVTLIGLVVLIPFLITGLAFANAANPVAKLIGAILLSAPVLFGMLGSAGLARRIGVGLPSSIDESQPWRPTLRGGIVLAFSFLLPVIGWFFVMPWTLISGLGAALMSLPGKQAATAGNPPVVQTGEAG